MSNKLKIFFLLLGDVAVLYVSLFVALLIRYAGRFYRHFPAPPSPPFPIFFIGGLYDLRRLRNSIDFLKMLGASIFVSAVIAVSLFYSIPAFGIAPKTTLFLFFVVFAILEILWRRLSNVTMSGGEAPNKVLLVGNGVTQEIERAIKENA